VSADLGQEAAMNPHERALAKLAEMEALASKAGDGSPAQSYVADTDAPRAYAALRAVLELHQSWQSQNTCQQCDPDADGYGAWPCPTVTRLAQALEGSE